MAMFTMSQACQLYEAGNFQEAYAAFRHLIKDNPRDGRMHAMLAYLEIQVGGDLDEAEALIKKAETLDCPEGYYHRVRGELTQKKGQHEEAVREYELSVAAEPSVSNLSAFAMALSDVGDKRSLSIWEKVLEKDAKNCKALLYCGWEAENHKEFYKALGMAKLAEDLEPSNPAVLFAIGYIYNSLKWYQQALK